MDVRAFIATRNDEDDEEEIEEEENEESNQGGVSIKSNSGCDPDPIDITSKLYGCAVYFTDFFTFFFDVHR